MKPKTTFPAQFSLSWVKNRGNSFSTAMKSSSSSKQKDQGIVETEGKDEVLERGGGEGQIKGSEAGSTSRQIKFSKRRNSLLRKAEEIATLCDSEVGLIIFACTGQLYEYSSTSMKEIIERYNNQKGESHEALETNAPSDIKVLQDEVASLKLQIQDLQDRNRRLMGETSDMGIKDLEILENQLELHLSAVRLQKDQHRSGYIKELHLKRNRVHQENIELKEKMDLIGKGNKEYLNDEFYKERNSLGGADVCQSSHEHTDGRYFPSVPIQYVYQVPPPLPNRDDDDQTPVTTELGLGLP
ncbi:MADS-box transcription factor 57-like [Punica granatum]|uniref:MADS-box transcription factor 57-like n=1 Tax=Punica granatum TaxID=22663 RepID=A0A6P8C5Y4_PUNGR|nr:MADS-box transcription factor 57-like [Punica granatum]